MNNIPPKENTDNQEIDLVYLFRKIKDFFQSIRFGIFKFIQFCLNKIIYIITLIVVGGILGYFMDQNLPEEYKHETIVAVNFDSAEYLYNFINKKKEKNSKITKVTIVPVYDVFQLISDNQDHLRALTFLSDAGLEIADYKKGTSNIFLYRYHLLTIYTNGKDEKGDLVNNFLSMINNNPYFVKKQKIEYQNNKNKIEEFKKSIQNINSVFESITKDKSSASVDITTYNQMNELTQTKSLLLKQLNKLETELAEQNVAVFPTVIQNNISASSFGYIVKIPFLFLFIFFMVFWMISWFKNTKKAYLLRN